MDNLLEEFKSLTGETDDTLVSSFILSESYLTEDAILSGITNYRLSPYARRLQNEKKKSQDVSTE